MELHWHPRSQLQLIDSNLGELTPSACGQFNWALSAFQRHKSTTEATQKPELRSHRDTDAHLRIIRVGVTVKAGRTMPNKFIKHMDHVENKQDGTDNGTKDVRQ